jgi:heat shock 70kDa protein 1/2/6/8
VSIKHTLNDDASKGKIDEGERQTLLGKIEEVEGWMGSHHDADAAEFEAKQKDLERVANPIMSKMYSGAGARAGGAQGPQGQEQREQQPAGYGHNVDEVDGLHHPLFRISPSLLSIIKSHYNMLHWYVSS